MNPAALSFSTTYNAFKNNDYQAMSISSSGTVAGSDVARFSDTITLAREQSVAQIYFSTNRAAGFNLYTTGEWYVLPAGDGGSLDYDDGTITGFPGSAAYSVFFRIAFTNTQLTITVEIPNPYSLTLSDIAATYNFKIYTFVAPFAA